MRLIRFDREPRKYNLRWDSHNKAIVVELHSDCLGFVKKISKTALLIQRYLTIHKLNGLLDSFSGDLSGESFGFNHALQKTRVFGDYLEFRVQLPKIKNRTSLACVNCSGTGKSIENFRKGETCLYCDGNKVQHTYDWKSAYAITSSLSLLFFILDVEKETKAKEYQHALVSMSAQYGSQGSSIDGFFGTDFMDYISSNPFELRNIILKNVAEAMNDAHAYMFLNSSSHAHGDVRIDFNSSSIGLTVPGDACGVNVGFYDRKPGKGCQITCHNVDTPFQSLIILSGLASLIGQASFYIDANQEKLLATVK